MEKLVRWFALNLGTCVGFHHTKPHSPLVKAGMTTPSHARAPTTRKPPESFLKQHGWGIPMSFVVDP